MKQICYQIVTDQQTGQKIQIVTALDQTTTSKQFILTNHDGSTPSKVILARQDATPGKVFLTTPDAAGGQLFFTSPDISAQHIQVWCPILWWFIYTTFKNESLLSSYARQFYAIKI